MTFDKKPSKYSDSGAVGSAEELDAYGVWVKSEPQDLTASLAETVNFDAEAVPYETDFDTGFGADFGTDFSDLEDSNLGFEDFEHDIPELSAETDDAGGFDFDDEIKAEAGRGTEEASTQLLMKIAGELSSIRTELRTLKREFADIRAESGIKAGTRQDDFFDGEEDEKIALTGDEMEDFLASTDFSGDEAWSPAGEALGFDALREADEAALKELADQNETSDPDEEIEIDFDNLGIDLTGDAEEEVQAEVSDDFPPLEDEVTSLEDDASSLDDEVSALEDDVSSLDEEVSALEDDAAFNDDFGTISFDETSSLETAELGQEEELQDFAEELVPLDQTEDTEELKELRLEGAVPHTPAPDNSDYLEGDPFALDDAGLENTTLKENTVIEDTVSEDTSSGETTALEDTVTEDLSLGESSADLSFDDVSFDLDDFSGEDTFSLDDEETTETAVESLTSFEEEISVEQEQIPDAGSMDLSEAVIDEPDLSSGIVEAPLEEPVLGDISFDDDISLDMDDFGAGADLEVKDSGPSGEIVEELVIDDFGTDVDSDLKDDSFEEDDSAIGPGDSVSDSLAQVIPEGFEVNAQEAAVSLDDDLEGFGDEFSVDGGEISRDEVVAASFAGADLAGDDVNIPADLKKDLKNVLSYMDHLLESLPEDKIEEFAKSEYFETYKKIFKDLGLV